MLQQAKQRFLLAAPLIALPFLCGIFYALGGGHDNPKVTDARLHGLNTELPGAFPDPRKAFLDKAKAYLKADQDSQRKQEYAEQDPYRRKPGIDSVQQVTSRKPVYTRPGIPTDPKANELLRQLNRLKESLQQPPPVRTLPEAFPATADQAAHRRHSRERSAIGAVEYHAG